MRLLRVLALLCLAVLPIADAHAAPLKYRWLFVWNDMSNPAQVDRVIARLPAAAAAGYNGVALSCNVAPTRAQALRDAARAARMEIVAIVMGGPRNRNDMEGLPAVDVPFKAHDGILTHVPSAVTVANADFEQANGDRFAGWAFQDDIGATTFADHEAVHGGKTSLRMQDINKNQYAHCRIHQRIKLVPHRQYHISVWIKTRDLAPADAEVKVLAPSGDRGLCFQTFRVAATQDWKQVHLVFNSQDQSEGLLYLGTWNGKQGAMWWDDLRIEEMGLVNVLRRAGCPVTVKGADGTVYEEGRDFQRIVDPQLHPWIPYHEEPVVRLAPSSRIHEGDQVLVTSYHPLVVYEDRLTGCLTEPRTFEDWAREVKEADAALHPAHFLMSHDEMRVMNQCAGCRSRNMTPGELLAWNVRKAAAIIRTARPDAGIWVWNDMFDPMHNAVDNYYAVNGSLKGSWKGLDKDVGIINWHGGLKGKNCRFFADLGLRQILSGYYDGDEKGDAIAEWQAATRDVPGIVGAMYTTWEDRYDAMTAWGKRAWGNGK